MVIIPMSPVANQLFSVVLGTQPCQIQIGQKSTGLFMDLYVNNALIVGGVICQDRNRIVRNSYLGFIGDVAFFDTQGTADPVYTGLNTRWKLAYFTLSEITAAGLVQ